LIVHHVSSSRPAEYFFGYIYQSRRWVILLLSTNISDFLYFFFIVRPVLKIIKTNISKYKRAAILYSESSIKTLCRCDNERNNHFPFDLVYLDAQQHKTLKDENSCGKDGYD
jgi:hypothetical protein